MNETRGTLPSSLHIQTLSISLDITSIHQSGGEKLAEIQSTKHNHWNWYFVLCFFVHFALIMCFPRRCRGRSRIVNYQIAVCSLENYRVRAATGPQPSHLLVNIKLVNEFKVSCWIFSYLCLSLLIGNNLDKSNWRANVQIP